MDLRVTAGGNDRAYRVEFSYRTKRDKQHRLASALMIRGIAVCVIAGDDPKDRFISIGTAVCSMEDQYSRRLGRSLAFADAVERCGILREYTVEFSLWFNERFPPMQRHAPVKPHRLTPAQIAERRDSPEAAAIRHRRQLARGVTVLDSRGDARHRQGGA